MRLDEARELKRALLTGTVVLRLPDDGEPLDIAAGGGFVGIVPSDTPAGYRLAVRLTQQVEDHEAYVAAIRAVAGDEVDVRFVGPVRALSQAPDIEDGVVADADAVVYRDGGDADTGAYPGDGDAIGPVVVPTQLPTPDELQQRVRPLVRGASVAHVDVTAGSIGAFVSLDDSEAAHLLSNNHVLGDSDRGEPGDDVLQPGPADGGSTSDRIGELLVAVPLDADSPNLIDAALAVVDTEIEVNPAAHDGALTGVVEAADVVGLVAKIGRTTGLTTGRISAIEVDGVPVGYDTGVFVFDDQIEIESVDGAFSAGGDSGSVIYTHDERLGVGLLFAGSTTGGAGGEGVTYANALSTVLAALGATLL